MTNGGKKYEDADTSRMPIADTTVTDGPQASPEPRQGDKRSEDPDSDLKRIADRLKELDHLGPIDQSLSKIGTAFSTGPETQPTGVTSKPVSPIAAEIEVRKAKRAVLKLTLKNKLDVDVDGNVQVFFEGFTKESEIGKPAEKQVPGWWNGKLPAEQKTTIDFAFAPKLLGEMRKNLSGKAARLTVEVQIARPEKPMEPMGTHFLNVVVPSDEQEGYDGASRRRADIMVR